MRSVSPPTSGSVAATFLAPVLELLPDCLHTRHCPALPDEAWVHLGLQRVLHELPSGRAFLQQHAFGFAYVWDKACIDFHAWHRWKQAHGLYFVSLEKENMKLGVTGTPAWDRADPVNAGIQSVEWVFGIAGVLLRRIRYLEPVSGTE